MGHLARSAAASSAWGPLQAPESCLETPERGGLPPWRSQPSLRIWKTTRQVVGYLGGSLCSLQVPPSCRMVPWEVVLLSAPAIAC